MLILQQFLVRPRWVGWPSICFGINISHHSSHLADAQHSPSVNIRLISCKSSSLWRPRCNRPSVPAANAGPSSSGLVLQIWQFYKHDRLHRGRGELPRLDHYRRPTLWRDNWKFIWRSSHRCRSWGYNRKNSFRHGNGWFAGSCRFAPSFWEGCLWECCKGWKAILRSPWYLRSGGLPQGGWIRNGPCWVEYSLLADFGMGLSLWAFLVAKWIILYLLASRNTRVIHWLTLGGLVGFLRNQVTFDASSPHGSDHRQGGTTI